MAREKRPLPAIGSRWTAKKPDFLVTTLDRRLVGDGPFLELKMIEHAATSRAAK